MKSKERIIVGLHSDRVRVCVVRNGSTVREAWSHADTTESNPWDDALRAYDTPLRDALERAQVAGAKTVDVIYDAPTAAVSAGPVPASGREGAESALLDLETRGAADLSVQPHSAWCVRDRLCVAVTDSNLTIDIIERLLERADLTVRLALPVEAVGLSGALALHACVDNGTPRVTALLGHWASGVVVSSEDGVRFVRSSPLTTDALGHSLTGIGDDENALSPIDAASLLERFGVPDVKEQQTFGDEIRSHEARAALQPLLQRAAVDLRQSMRFGLSREDQERVSVTFGGDAAKIGRVVEIVADLIDADQHSQQSFDETSHTVACLDALGLTPEDRASRARTGRLMRAVWGGAGVALAVSVMQGVMAQASLSQTQDVIARMQSGSSGMEQMAVRQQAVDKQQQTLARLDRAIANSAGFGPRYPGWLVDLAELRPDGVVVLGMNASRNEGDGGLVNITGAVYETETIQASDATDVLRSFLDALEASPLVADVALGSTRRGTALGGESTGFQLTVRLRSAPARMPGTDVAEVTP